MEKCRRYLIISKKQFWKRVHSRPKVGVLNVDFALKLRIYRSLKSLICLKYKSKRKFPQYCILSSSTLHSRSLPLKVMEKDRGENLDIWKAKIEKRAKGNLYIKVMEKRARGEFWYLGDGEEGKIFKQRS